MASALSPSHPPANLTAEMAIDFAGHRARFLDALPDDGLVVLFSGMPVTKSADEEYPFQPNRNFYYLTGLDRPNQVVVLSRLGSERTAVAFVEPPDPHAEAWTGKMMTMEEARQASAIEDIRPLAHWLSHLNRLIESGRYPHVFLDLEHRTWAQAPSDAVRFAQRLLQKHPGVSVKNCFAEIAALRRIKSAGEVFRIRAAVAHTRAGLASIIANARPGAHEFQLLGQFTGTLIGGGAGLAYAPIIASGANATILHYTTCRERVAEGDAVLVDAAAEFGYYKSDITRTFPAGSRFTREQAAVYDVVLEASREATAAIRPGTAHADLQRVTRRVLAQGMKALGHLRDEAELERYYFHGVSHYLGLDTHDVGAYGELEPGMVMTVEPGLYVKDLGLGVRIEDDVLVTDAGVDLLSADIPSDRGDVESWGEALRHGGGR